MSKRKIQLVLFIGMALILLVGCAISKGKILPTGAVIINTKQKPVDIIIKTNERYKNMQDFKASKIINDDNGVMKEEIMIKGNNYKKSRESFEKKNIWYVKNKITEISNGNKVWITKTTEPSNLKIKEVEKILENKVTSDPNEYVYIKLGMIYSGFGKVEEAEEMFKKAISLYPNDLEGFLELGLLYKNQGKIEESEELLRKSIDIIQNFNQIMKGNNSAEAADYHLMKAIDALKEAKKNNPDYQGKKIDVGEMDEDDSERKMEVAKEIFKYAIEVMPNNEKFYEELGWIYKMEGDINKAEEILKKPINMNLPSEGVLYELGRIYKVQKKYEKARAAFEKIIDAYPNDTKAYIELGSVYLSQGNAKEAEEIFKKAIDIDSSDYLTYELIGSMLYSYFDIRKAEEVWEKATSLKPDDELLSGRLGWIYVKQGKFNDAEEMFKRNLKINKLPTYEVKEENRYDEIQYINDFLDFNKYNFILKQNKSFYFLEGKKMKNTALWSKIKAEINKGDFSVTKLEFYEEVDGKEKLVKSIIYEYISFNNNFDDKEFAIIEE